jgi:8-oxo-dGTP pyrophosphatase MutT (NUDIX family)
MNRTDTPAIGICVGTPAMGYHLAAAGPDGRVFALSSFPEPAAVLRWLESLPGNRSAVIAIGSSHCSHLPPIERPPAEQILRRFEDPAFRTIRSGADSVPAWMAQLWAGLSAAFPGAHIVETFPRAAAERLLDSQLQVPLGLFHGRKRRPLRPGLLDALVAADTAWRLARTKTTAYSSRDPVGAIHLPDCFREHTLCLVRNENRLLLGRKKRGFGAGYWNGFGGKIEPGETVAAAARRELHEECGLRAGNLVPVGELSFVFADGTEPIHGHVFLVTDFTGTLRESDEMAPRWFSLEKIPYMNMWEDDRYWLPQALAGRRFRAIFRFGTDGRLAEQGIDLSG